MMAFYLKYNPHIVMYSLPEIRNHFDIPSEVTALHTGKGFAPIEAVKERFTIFSPVTQSLVITAQQIPESLLDEICTHAQAAFLNWREVPAPKRGEFVRLIGDAFRKHRAQLAHMITYEVGKTLRESEGEVQEVIDICDFACGLSRQIGGINVPSERVKHRLMEQYHPLGPILVISAFNFPVAVWAWNTMLALVCGNSVVWKPSEKSAATAAAAMQIIAALSQKFDFPDHLIQMVLGGKETSGTLSTRSTFPLVSATGSIAMGRDIAQKVAARLGRSLLELGGNNATIITPYASLDLAAKFSVFSIIGTAGQRCTSLRRLIIHTDVYTLFLEKLIYYLNKVVIGDPRDPNTLMGPLVNEEAVKIYELTIEEALQTGGKICFGGKRLKEKGDLFVMPTLIEVPKNHILLTQERFVPITYVVTYSGDVLEAIQIQNSVEQGLSSSIFTNNVEECELFLSAQGSDCGLANVNLGTSGAEIGLAFGGEKQTGGGRESGSDAWKNYMRRQSCSVNFSGNIQLAQGIMFEV